MRYDYFSMVDASNGVDSILRVRQVPDRCWDHIRGRKRRVTAFIGHGDEWRTPDGRKVSSRMSSTLRRLWEEQKRSRPAYDRSEGRDGKNSLTAQDAVPGPIRSNAATADNYRSLAERAHVSISEEVI